MNTESILNAAKELAAQVNKCVLRIRQHNSGFSDVYVVSLVIADDFDCLMLCFNTREYFERSDRSMISKWGFAEWGSDGLDLSTSELINQLGTVEDFDVSPEIDNGPFWLAAMTEGLRLAKTQNAFGQVNNVPYLFCSMIDSLNAIWLENISAEYLNPTETFATTQPEINAAQREWYCGKSDDSAFKLAYGSAIRKLAHTG